MSTESNKLGTRMYEAIEVAVMLKDGEKLVRVSEDTLALLEDLSKLWGVDVKEAARCAARLAYRHAEEGPKKMVSCPFCGIMTTPNCCLKCSYTHQDD